MRKSTTYNLSILLLCAPHVLRADPLEIYGTARIEGHVGQHAQGITISGAVRDELEHPIRNSHVRIRLYSSDGSQRVIPFPSPVACDRASTAAPSYLREWSDEELHHELREERALDTDGNGEFCVLTRVPEQKVLLVVQFDGSAHLDAAQSSFAFDSSDTDLRVTLDASAQALSLDTSETRIAARISGPPILPIVGAEPLRVELSDEKGTRLDEAVADSRGNIAFRFDTALLGPPGSGELITRIVSPRTVSGRSSVPVRRSCLATPRVLDSTLRGIGEDGVAVLVRAACTNGQSATGRVELNAPGAYLGAAELREGLAETHAVTVVQSPTSIDASATYVPDTPYFRAGPPASLRIQVLPAPWWRKVIQPLAALFVIWWATGRKWPSGKARRGPSRPQPIVAVASAMRRPAGALSPEEDSFRYGELRDAHDQSPIAGAEVAVFTGAFAGETLHCLTSSDEQGCFRLEHLDSPRSPLSIRVRAPLYRTFESPLPIKGAVRVALVSRRRAALDRFARWTRAQGIPARPEPTPAEVAQSITALETELYVDANGLVQKRWLRGLERAVFGPHPFDESAEAEVIALSAEAGSAGPSSDRST